MRNQNAHTLGSLGEILAQNFLRRKGYHILTTNYHTQYGEIDIVAKKDHMLIFIEVKTRSVASPESALHAVSMKKRLRLSRTASIYLQNHPQWEDCYTRFDIIAVYLDKTSSNFRILHMEEAFLPFGIG